MLTRNSETGGELEEHNPKVSEIHSKKIFSTIKGWILTRSLQGSLKIKIFQSNQGDQSKELFVSVFTAEGHVKYSLQQIIMPG